VGIAANWSRENLAWAAGLFEGEGSISKRNNLLTLTSTDEDVVRKFMVIVGMGRIIEWTPTAGQLGKKKQWIWNLYRQECGQALLAAFWPWLGERRRKRVREYLHHMANAHRNRSKLGSEHSRSKLTESLVVEILASTDTQVALATKYGVGQTTISAIRKRKTWRHVNVDQHVRRTQVGSSESSSS
jgi:hypothetical protein